MTATTFFLVCAAAWVLLGIALAHWMARRGHSAFVWGLLGVSFGPLAIPLAIEARRRTGARPATRSPDEHVGPVDILVGTDGSRQARAALTTVGRLFGPRVGRLTLVRVLDFDLADADVPDDRNRIRAELEADAEAGGDGLHPEPILLAGEPAEVLIRYAADRGYDLIVVGRRGRGASKFVLGSVASRLARSPAVPTLIVGSAREARSYVATTGGQRNPQRVAS